MLHQKHEYIDGVQATLLHTVCGGGYNEGDDCARHIQEDKTKAAFTELLICRTGELDTHQRRPNSSPMSGGAKSISGTDT